MHSEIWLNWGLQITHLYNKCRGTLKVTDVEDADTKSEKMDSGTSCLLLPSQSTDYHANICSNMYPALLLPLKAIDFAYVLQVIHVICVQ